MIENDKRAYDPVVSVGNSDSEVSIGIVNDHITDESISSNTRIKMIIYDGSKYSLCNLVCTTLPLVSIDCPTDITKEDTHMNITLFDNEKNSKNRVINSEGMIRVRGATSTWYPKKSFKISLRDGEKRRDISFLGMRQDDDWILYSCYADYERVRNVFSQNLWTDSCGTDNAYKLNTGSYYKFVELFLNGEYYGLYALGYKTDLKTLGIEKFGEDEGLFMKTAHRLTEFESDEPLDIIYDYYDSIEEHADDRQYLMSCVDLDNAIDFFLYITLIQGCDNYDKNYMVLVKHFYDGKRAIYIPWDMDLTWGDMWNEGVSNRISFYELNPEFNAFPYDTSISQLLLSGDEETYDLLLSKYTSNRKHGWSEESIDALLNGLEDDLFASGAYYRDCEKWPESGTVEGINSLDRFRQYVHERLLEMDAYVNRLQNGHSNNPLINQLLSYKNPNDYRFLVVSKYSEMLEDPVISEFIDYVGEDQVTVSDDVELDGFRVINEYISSTEGREIMVYAFNGERYEVLNPDASCRFRVDGTMLTTSSLWLRCLDKVFGNILLQINEADSLDIDKERFLQTFDIDCGSYNSVREILDNNNSLVFLLNSDDKKGCFIEDAYSSGTQVSTELGDWAYYEGEDNFGIYINGEECIVDTLSSRLGYNIRITEFSRDWKDIICDFSE